jgi:FkbM family methyltransferase
MHFKWTARATSTTATKLAMMSILAKILRGFLRVFNRGPWLSVHRQNLNWKLDAREAIDCCLILTGHYEEEVERMYHQFLKPGDVVVDIGANMGAHTLPMANLVGEQGKVFAIEATEFAYSKLHNNCLLNPHLKNIIQTEHVFLTDDLTDNTQQVSASWNIEKKISDPARHPLDKGIGCDIGAARKLTFDQWAQSQQLERLDLLKIDVDGNEVQVLSGALSTLARLRPRILMELSPIHYEGREQKFTQQLNLLLQLGYRFFDHKGRSISASAEEVEQMIPRGVLINVMGVMA